MAAVGLPHWLMMTGTILVLFGLSGFALSRNKALESNTGIGPDEGAERRSAEEAGDVKVAR